MMCSMVTPASIPSHLPAPRPASISWPTSAPATAFLLDGVLRGFNGSTATVDQFVRIRRRDRRQPPADRQRRVGRVRRLDQPCAARWCKWPGRPEPVPGRPIADRQHHCAAHPEPAGELRRPAIHRFLHRPDRRLRRQPNGRGAALSRRRADRRASGRHLQRTQYLRNYSDLGTAFGTNVDLATRHFITNGLAEGRNDDPSIADADPGLQYIASYSDLAAAYGANATAGQQHYVSFGQGEGRALDTFNETQYLANYADLQAAFGADTEPRPSTSSPTASPKGGTTSCSRPRRRIDAETRAGLTANASPIHLRVRLIGAAAPCHA